MVHLRRVETHVEKRQGNLSPKFTAKSHTLVWDCGLQDVGIAVQGSGLGACDYGLGFRLKGLRGRTD